jgi:hypothetical protein
MLTLGLGKKFLQLYVFLLDLKVILSNSWRRIHAYTLHQDLSFIVIEKTFSKVATRVKGLTPL